MKRVVLATLWLLRKNISRKKQETPLSVPEAAVYCAMFSKTITATTEVLAEHMPFTHKNSRDFIISWWQTLNGPMSKNCVVLVKLVVQHLALFDDGNYYVDSHFL